MFLSLIFEKRDADSDEAELGPGCMNLEQAAQHLLGNGCSCLLDGHDMIKLSQSCTPLTWT